MMFMKETPRLNPSPCGRKQSVIVILFILNLLAIAAPAADPVRERLSFDSDWRFAKDDPSGTGDSLSYTNIKPWVTATGYEFVSDGKSAAGPAGNPGADVAYTQSGFDDSAWRQLNLPHDWGMEGPFKQEAPGSTGKLPWEGVGWYRKHFTVPASDQDHRLCLEVDGAMSYANVWLNGQYVGGWPYGYSSWELDLTPYIKPGAENVLAIRLDNPPASSRWYPGGGIYRNVWLVKTGPVHVAHWGTYVTTPEVSEKQATVRVQFTLDNDSDADALV
jgi:beta-galactosidase